MTDEEIIMLFRGRREERLRKEWGTYQPRQPIASDLGDCRRYQVVRLFGWQQRSVPDSKGLATIEQGRVMEPAIIAQLQAEGFEIVETQVTFDIRQPLVAGGPRKRILSGRIDGKVRIDGKLIPFDAKDTSEWTLRRVESQADLAESPWTRKWANQLQIYMLGENIDTSLIVLAHRGERRIVVVHLDYDAAEKLLQLATWAVRVAEEFEAKGVTGETVDQALNDLGEPYHAVHSICRSCPFLNTACFPPEPTAVAAQARADLAEQVARYLELKPLTREAERLRKFLLYETEGYPQTVAGEFVIEGAVKTRRNKEQPAKPAYVSEYWSIDVRRAGERGSAEDDAA